MAWRFIAHLMSFLLAQIIPMCAGDFELTIVHTNDVRARFEPISAQFGGDCTKDLAAQGDCFGGLARRVTVINEIRRSRENVLLLDAGHQFQGSMWFYVNRGLAAAHFMNRLSYDAMAIGQHEFDLGVEGLARFIDNVTFPILASNIDTTGEKALDGLLLKQRIVRFANGQRVGLVGYTYANTPEIANTGNLTFTEELVGLQPAVDKLVSEGVNKIIALGHSGYDKAVEIARKLVGVDVVVSGRDPMLLHNGPKPSTSTETPIGDYPTVIHPDYDPTATVLVVQAYAYGKYIGSLNVSFDDGGALSGYGGNTILLDESVAEDNDTLNEMKPWRAHVTEVANQKVGRTYVVLDYAACASNECALGNLVADAMLFPNLNASDGWSDVGVAMTTTGSMGGSLDVGEITIGEINKVLPFGDTIDVVEMRGSHVLEALENSVFDRNGNGRNEKMMQLSGIRVAYDLARAPGQRVLATAIRCAICPVPKYYQLDLNAIYKVVVNSYIAQGKYGYSSIRDKISIKRGGLDTDTLKAYLETFSPISSSVELGRQVFYNGNAPCYSNVESSGNSLHGYGLWLGLVLSWFVLSYK